jgi:hypothetical protein
MTRQFSIPVLALTVALAAAPAQADVKKEERNQVTFGGVLGGVFKFFGGKGAKEGVVSTVAVSGDRKMTTTGDNTAQIIDLREEKIYDLDIRRKTYKVTTFDELRRQMREAEAKAREAAARESRESRPSEPAKKDPNEKEMEVDFDVKNTGQTKTINGFDTRQVIATITVREKGKKLQESGGLVMTVDTWLSKSAPSMKEVMDFDRRYYEKLAGPISAVDAQQMATAMAMFPGLKDAFARLSKEDFGGTAIQTTTTTDAVKSAEQMKQEAAGGSSASSDEKANPLSVGGAIGGFMRRRQQKPEETTAKPNADPSRSTFMTLNNEVLKITTNVTAAEVAMPAGFKERN